jgi:hypothetical protein
MNISCLVFHNVTPCIFLKKIRVVKQHALYQMGLAKVF